MQPCATWYQHLPNLRTQYPDTLDQNKKLKEYANIARGLCGGMIGFQRHLDKHRSLTRMDQPCRTGVQRPSINE